MSYFTLTPNQGYMLGSMELNSSAKSKAEAWATLRIDEAFFAYDRSAWSGATLPTQIADIAEKLTAGKYLELVFAVGNPVVDPNSLSRTLLRGGEEAIVRVLDAGGIINPENPTLLIYPIYSRPAGRTVRMLRG